MARQGGHRAGRSVVLAALLGFLLVALVAANDAHAPEGELADPLGPLALANESLANESHANESHAAAHALEGGEHVAGEHVSLEEEHMEEVEAEGEVEAHHAMIFFVIAVLVSVAVLHALTSPYLKALQHTVVLFVIGMLYSVAQRSILQSYPESLGVVGETNAMWLSIDPHLILWSMLPILIAGDGMSADTTVSRDVAVQCIWLAGPGVLFIAVLTAYFVWWFIPAWSFKLAFTLGSILAATDPVAVLSLLKELGASTVLAQQISGESLLNDGTAIVLFTMAYAMLEGEEFDVHDVIIFLTKMALFAVGFGWVIGSLFCGWIHSAENRFQESSGTIQVVLTICCAYISFIGAELLGMSGVLSTVAASLVLADQMWPSIVDKEGLHHVWHLLEFLANTVIFFLAGALTGNAMFEIKVQDVINLIVIYLASTVIRAMMVYGSLPVLKLVHPKKEPVSLADATVMVWGGLRGAVGLALAFQVHLEMAHGKISFYEGNQVMFYISGMAFLTLIFNATTCPNLVSFLRLTRPTATTRKILLWFHARLVEQANEHEQECCAAGAEIMHWVLDDVKHHVESMSTTDDADQTGSSFRNLLAQKPRTVNCARPAELVEDFKLALQEYRTVANVLKERMPKLPESTFADKRKVLLNLADPLRSGDQQWADNSPPAGKGPPKVQSVIYGATSADQKQADEVPNLGGQTLYFDPLLMIGARSSFLELVRANYWEQINDGFFGQHGGGRAEALLHSIEGAMASNGGKMNDLDFLQNELTPLGGEESEIELAPNGSSLGNAARRLAKSERFRIFVSMTIVISVIIDIIWDNMKSAGDPPEHYYAMWLGLEVLLFFVFFAEQAVRLFAFKMAFFKKMSNCFDMLLVLLILIAIGFEIAGKEGFLFTADFWIFRLIRVFRTLVPMRIADAIRFWQRIKKQIGRKGFAAEQAHCMEHILMYTAFCKAHVHAQREFVEFFGQQGMPRSGEQACVILESHTLVYRGSVAALRAAATLEQEALDDLNVLREGTTAVESMRKFIGHAQEQNVISASAAETLMEPMVNKQQDWINHIANVELGTATGTKNMPSRAANKSESYRKNDEFTGAVPPPVRKAPKSKKGAGLGSCLRLCGTA